MWKQAVKLSGSMEQTSRLISGNISRAEAKPRAAAKCPLYPGRGVRVRPRPSQPLAEHLWSELLRAVRGLPQEVLHVTQGLPPQCHFQ